MASFNKTKSCSACRLIKLREFSVHHFPDILEQENKKLKLHRHFNGPVRKHVIPALFGP